MPPRSLVQDKEEAIRWLVEDDRSYEWMVQRYLEKYNIQTTISMWASFRHRNGLPRKISRDRDLIPWEVLEEHRWGYPVVMLRFEGRRREGRELSEYDAGRLDSWKQMLENGNLVVHYVPDTDDGWFYVPRDEGDTDIIRVPRNN
ncbi:hypothetical protein ACFVTF_26590 [Kitasatospora sp. NPDC057940]|uniref:hypothetical protein n=1 Tax=Kitasatospora sp. NPDC057940 TaxID=3346285 RepID=UPI0036D986EC